MMINENLLLGLRNKLFSSFTALAGKQQSWVSGTKHTEWYSAAVVLSFNQMCRLGTDYFELANASEKILHYVYSCSITCC